MFIVNILYFYYIIYNAKRNNVKKKLPIQETNYRGYGSFVHLNAVKM